MKRALFLLLAITGVMFTSCENGDWEFPDYEYTAVYFAYQSPIRTICLGEDIFDTTLDNDYKCQIMATMGGVYKNNKNIEIGIRVDNSLCDGLVFDGTDKEVTPMPSNYYSLSSDKIVIEKGKLLGGVTVQLTDAFFNDPKSITTTYVIPVVMTSVNNADSILSGTPVVANPRRAVADDWDVVPKDYTLYAVKYINKWEGNYLRRGTDVVTINGATENVTRKHQYVEKDEVFGLNTISLTDTEFPIVYANAAGLDLPVSLNLAFDNSNACAVTPVNTLIQVNDSVRVYNITAKGNGRFVELGEKNSWGNQDRDALYLEFETGFEVEMTFPKSGKETIHEKHHYVTDDILVARDRGMKAEWFTPAEK
ncbi:hypothetical protein M2137_000871 [Parabacteroides sp. PFB2-10]|uniref:DUF5627 domain-containing protein n=1 Tax=Parabacteroides sp. PFB2-10 TaxID=1742405 RepID=UPI0024768063|nr:DUF5627 domain-containing protein [Parabacteroides sp. PFB2-10]MDH6312108.1 hypothetical protein [Parabacteroides sp. PFB2-10]MDL2244553.1 DUF5627 domain-containing protein [Parabacteroides sp. OttesenSCG-928-J18]